MYSLVTGFIIENDAIIIAGTIDEFPCYKSVKNNFKDILDSYLSLNVIDHNVYNKCFDIFDKEDYQITSKENIDLCILQDRSSIIVVVEEGDHKTTDLVAKKLIELYKNNLVSAQEKNYLNRYSLN